MEPQWASSRGWSRNRTSQLWGEGVLTYGKARLPDAALRWGMVSPQDITILPFSWRSATAERCSVLLREHPSRALFFSSPSCYFFCEKGSPCRNVATVADPASAPAKSCYFLAQSPLENGQVPVLFCSTLLSPPKGMSQQVFLAQSPKSCPSQVLLFCAAKEDHHPRLLRKIYLGRRSPGELAAPTREG